MKKIIAFILVAVMALSLASCSSEKTDTFVKEDDGQEYTIAITHKKDVVTKFEMTVEVELTDEMTEQAEFLGGIDGLADMVAEEFSEYSDLDCCELDVETTDEAIVISIVITELDDKDNLEDLEGIDIFSVEEDYVSYENMADNLEDNDFEKE